MSNSFSSLNGLVNLSGSINLTGSLLINGTTYSGGTGTSGTSGTSGIGVISSFARGSRSTQQTTGLTTGSTVVFTQTDIYTGSDISLNTSTGKITLAAGKTYRLIAHVPGFTGAAGALSLCWYNENTSTWIGNQSEIYTPTNNAAYGAMGGFSEAILTTTGSTVVSYRISSISGISALGGNTDFATTGSYPWFDIQVISGNGAAGSSGTSGTSGISGSSGSSGSSGTTPIYSGSLSVTNQIQSTATGSQPTMVNTNDGSGIILSSYNGASGTGSLRIVSNGGAWTDNKVTTYLQISGSLGNNATFVGGTYGADVALDRTQFVSKQSQFTNASSYGLTPPSTHTLEAINVGTGTQAVFGVIGASGQTANLMDVATTGSNNVISVNNKGSLILMGGDSNTGSLWIKGNNTKGGSSYNEFLKITNTSGSISTPNKYFRQNGSGDIEILNSAYSSTLLTLTDAGNLTISGSIVMPQRPAFRVYGAGGSVSATTILSGSQTVVDYNQGNAWNNSNGTFTAPIAGLYQVNIVARCAGNADPSAQVIVRKNSGGTITTQIMLEWATNTTANHIGGSTITKLAVGDTLYAVVPLGSVSFDGNDNFSVAYIG